MTPMQSGGSGSCTRRPAGTTRSPCNSSSARSASTTSRSVAFALTANEDLNGATVTSADFTATNGTIASIACAGGACAITVTASAQGAVTIAPSGSFSVTDPAGNAQSSVTTGDLSVTYDTTAPTVTLEQGSLQADPTSGSLIAFRVTATEDLSTGSVTSGDVTITNGTFSSIEVVTARWVRIWVTASAQGAVTIAPSAAFSVSDVAGNATSSTVAGSDRSVTYDTIAPTLTLAQAAGQVDPTTSRTVNFSLTSGESILSGSVSTDDFTVTNGSISSIACTASGYTANEYCEYTTDCPG